MTRRERQGFTLIEVLVALVLTSILALLAHELFGAAVVASRRLESARVSLDRERNGERYLAAAFLSLEAGGDGAGPFEGRPDRVGFAAWVRTADGWFERRPVVLGTEGRRWIARTGTDERIVLADSVTSVRFDYLLEPGANAHWVSEWMSPVSAPLAVRIRLQREGHGVDTALYLIRARG